MHSVHPGILAENPNHARYLSFSIDSEESVSAALKELVGNIDSNNTVIGFGLSLVEFLDKKVDGLSTMSAQVNGAINVPSTPADLWCWLRGDDRGEIFLRSRQLEKILQPAFKLEEVTDAFQYDSNRDLSGYEDGTENPEGDEAISAALVQNAGPGLDGSSFVAVQKWLHDFDGWNAMPVNEQDDVIGRHVADNEEFDEAPESAHVKRSAQESYDPEAFIVRRSMPWAEANQGGLMFVAFGKSFDAFEAILNRMIGKEDGIADALFKFTKPVTGAYYWCPPVKENRLDLSLLDI